MTNLEQAVENAVDDIIVALIVAQAPNSGRWRNLEVAANRLRKVARELQRTQTPEREQ